MIYKIIPKGGFHFGRTGIGIEEADEIVHSDTLFAALASAWSSLGGEYGKIGSNNNLHILEPFRKEKPPFKISSAFPYAGEVLFFPCPYVGFGRYEVIKKVKYISVGALKRLNQSTIPSQKEAEREFIQGGMVWVTPEEREKIVELLIQKGGEEEQKSLKAKFKSDLSSIRLWFNDDSSITARVALGRVTKESALYFQGQLRFAEGCGLYFWVEFYDSSYKKYLESALNFLEDEGIGGRRSIGLGQFIFKEESVPLPKVDAANYQMTLSLCHPSEEEIQVDILRQSQYELVKRCGWSRLRGKSDYRQRSLRMFKEGSIFPLNANLMGTFTDVSPIDEEGYSLIGQPVWRYGLALSLPLVIKFEEADRK